jgi:hypothetical protein
VAETFVAFIVVGLLTWRVLRSIHITRQGGRFRMNGLDPWIF